MKFHAVALCLAGTLAAGTAYAQDKMHHESTYSTQTYTGYTDTDWNKAEWQRLGYVKSDIYPYFREVMFPDLPSTAEVAAKVRDFNESNRREAAELRALGSRSRTAGFENVALVYEHMAQDHDRGADWAREWLVARAFTVPAEPTITLAADVTPETSIQQQIDMHCKHYCDAKEQLRTERSSHVRGLRLMTMATSLEHISLLETLDSDVDRGRRTLSARLQAMMDGSLVAGSREEFYSRIDTEEREYWASIAPPAETYDTAIAADVPAAESTAREVYVDREVEKIVEKPVYVERIVEKPIYITLERPAMTSKVAGSRQSTRRTRTTAARARRPAK